ncbi:MFS general substrate transporter [Thozetella sp. PMI_491]|nr:MFS general substrate transporter [Thozetella sp. PMI_491]
MLGSYVLNYMDKAALSEASIFGIAKDLNLVGQQYSWSSSIFYLGYLVWQYPSAILMQKFPIGRYFGVMIFLWGITATLTAVAKNFTTLCVNRVFLGVFETCMSPILTILIATYWTRDEQPLRTSIWWSGSAVGGYISDAVTYAVSGKPGGALTIWQASEPSSFVSLAAANTRKIVYLIVGPLTVCWGILIFFAVPTSPMTAWFLNERERKVATARVLESRTSVRNKEYKVYQVKECLMDPQAWMLAIHAFLQCIEGGGLTSFSKIVLTETLGFSSRQATLMSMPATTIHFVSVVVARFHNTRCYTMILTNVIVVIGAVLVGNLPESNANGRLGAFYIIYVNTVPFGLGMSMLSSNIGGFTKKATASVMMFIGYCVGQFVGPLVFISTESPNYPSAFKTFYTAVSLMIVIEIALIANRAARSETQDSDLTDWEQSDFRYHHTGGSSRSVDQTAGSADDHAQVPLEMASDSPLDASLPLLDSAVMPWIETMFDSYLDQPWELSLHNSVISHFEPSTTSTLPATGEDQMSAADIHQPSPGSTSAVSDHVLAQHYTRNLTSRYSSKNQGWNYHTYFFNRFNSSHPFVLSALYAWTSAHLFCSGSLTSPSNALVHYEKCLLGLKQAFGIEISVDVSSGHSLDWMDSGIGAHDFDAIAVAFFFLASTDLTLSRPAELQNLLALEADVLQWKDSDGLDSVFLKIATWFCFLDARTSAFGLASDRIIQAMGNEAGLLRVLQTSQDFLQKEYSLLYPQEEERRDQAHLPLYIATCRLIAILGRISRAYRGVYDSAARLEIRDSLGELHRMLSSKTEGEATKENVLSIYLTTTALYHAAEIYYSRAFLPSDPLFSENDHAVIIITTTDRFYQLLKRPHSEPPPTKIWPLPLVMAAIEARDSIYRGWATQKIREYARAGKHYLNSCAFVEKGLPYDRGLSHGTQVRDKVQANIAYYKLPGKLPDWSITSRIINTIYIPGLQKYYPTGLEEMRGIADGAGVPVEEVVMLNARYDLGRCMYRLRDGGRSPQDGARSPVASLDFADECTSGFFSPDGTASSETLAVHNWDMSSHLYDQDLIIYLEIHPDPSENCPSMFVLTEAGQMIRSGMNSAGMSVTANSLLCTTDYVPVPYIDQDGVYHDVEPKPVLPLSLARRVFLEHANYAGGLAAINAFPRHVSGNLHVSTAEGFCMALECAPERLYKFYGSIDDNYVIHSNHFLSPEFLSRDDVADRYPGGSSWYRFWQAQRGVRKQSREGTITPDIVKTAFSDHLAYPESLCNHPNRDNKDAPSSVLTGYTTKVNMTVAFVIYNLSQRKITVCKGPPCQGVLQEFRLETKNMVPTKAVV